MRWGCLLWMERAGRGRRRTRGRGEVCVGLSLLEGLLRCRCGCKGRWGGRFCFGGGGVVVVRC